LTIYIIFSIEIGRAGRDGLESSCHLLVNVDDGINNLSLNQSSRLSQLQIALFLSNLFILVPTVNNTTSTTTTNNNTNEVVGIFSNVAILLEKIEIECDISISMLETILSILEMNPYNTIEVTGSHYDTIKGSFRILPKYLNYNDIVIKSLLKLNKISPKYKKNKKKSSNLLKSSNQWTSIWDSNISDDGSGEEEREGYVYTQFEVSIKGFINIVIIFIIYYKLFANFSI
jgi:superfamily II DNA helicase RecQ